MARAGRKDRGLFTYRNADDVIRYGVRLAHNGRSVSMRLDTTNKTIAREFYEKVKTLQRAGAFDGLITINRNILEKKIDERNTVRKIYEVRGGYPIEYPDIFSSQGCIYFIQPLEGGLIKIGFTTNLLRRFEQIQGMSPVPLRLLGTISAPIDREQELHDRFHHHRQYGEWFNPDTEILQFLILQNILLPKNGVSTHAPSG